MINVDLFFELYLILYWILWLSGMFNVTHKTENQSVHLFHKPSFSKTIAMSYTCIFLNLYIHGLHQQLSFIMSYGRMIRNSTTVLHSHTTTPWDVWQPSAGNTLAVCVVRFVCNLEITWLQMKVKFQGSECWTGKDVEESSQFYLGIAWREWEKSRRICGKWGSQSLLKRIPGNWILMKNLTEQPLHEWGSEPGTKPVQHRSAQLITWLWDSAIWSNTKICTCHKRPSDIRKATIWLKSRQSTEEIH